MWSDERNLTRRVSASRKSTRKITSSWKCSGSGAQSQAGWSFFAQIRRVPPARVTREQFRARFDASSPSSFPDAVRRIAHRAKISSIPFQACTSAARCTKARMRGRCWLFPPAKTPRPSKGCSRSAFCGWIGCAVTSSRAPIDGLRLFVPEGSSRLLARADSGAFGAARTEIYELREPDGHDAENGSCGRGKSGEPAHSAAGNRNRNCDAAREAFAESARCFADTHRARSEPQRSRRERTKWRSAFAASNSRAGRRARSSFRRREAREPIDAATKTTPRTPDAPARSASQFARGRHESSALSRRAGTLARDDRPRRSRETRRATRSRAFLFAGSGARGSRPRRARSARRHARGRLVVIELKASEDIQMPIQAVDYWLRVRRHQREGDFQRYGYFAGIKLDPQPPLVWLVAPGLRFPFRHGHSSEISVAGNSGHANRR